MSKKKKPAAKKSLSEQNPNLRELSSGVIHLAQAEGPLVKKALLCRTGIWDGMFGQVVVTKELLEGIAERYNRERAKPINENDYAPVLVDHNRSADLVKGRVLANMTVEELADPAGGSQVGYGLYADLRIDDDDAQAKVKKGTYAQLSISFDEDDFAFDETSFVAVEAAKRSQILSQQKKEKPNMNLQKKFNRLAARNKAIVSLMTKSRKTRLAAFQKINEQKDALLTEATALSEKAQSLSLTLKSGQTKAQFAAFVPQGKITPAELKEMDFKALAQMPEAAFKVVLSSYEKRQPSPDVVQFGQSGTETNPESVPSKAKMKELMAAQKAGKKSLSEDPAAPAADPAKPAADPAAAKSYSMGEEDYNQCLKDISEVNEKLSAVLGKIKALGDVASDMAANDEKDKDEENKLSAESDDDSEEDGE